MGASSPIRPISDECQPLGQPSALGVAVDRHKVQKSTGPRSAASRRLEQLNACPVASFLGAKPSSPKHPRTPSKGQRKEWVKSAFARILVEMNTAEQTSVQPQEVDSSQTNSMDLTSLLSNGYTAEGENEPNQVNLFAINHLVQNWGSFWTNSNRGRLELLQIRLCRVFCHFG